MGIYKWGFPLPCLITGPKNKHPITKQNKEIHSQIHFSIPFLWYSIIPFVITIFWGDHDPKVTGSQWFTTCRAKDVRCFDLQPHTAKFEVAASMVWKGFS